MCVFVCVYMYILKEMKKKATLLYKIDPDQKKKKKKNKKYKSSKPL